MTCKHCGAELEADAKFCFSCGAKLEETQQTEPAVAVAEPVAEAVAESVTAVPVNKPDWKNWLRQHYPMVIRLTVGTLLILVGLIKIFSTGTSISSTAFGGDFYTYTYQGIVAITELLADIEGSLGWLIAAIGAWIDLGALRK